MKERKGKLTLSRETVCNLTDAQLAQILGGTGSPQPQEPTSGPVTSDPNRCTA